MTIEKMPDVIWADGFNDWFSKPRLESDPIGFKRDKYLRAEPVEELLKQCIPYLYNAENCELIIDINKFLGEK